jgi:DNA-3-methyladenine glycosylase I
MVAEAGSLAARFWRIEPSAEERPKKVDLAHLRANPTTAISVRISKELKKRGWSFVGPTTVYAFMQAMGLVNDHLEGCATRAAVEKRRRSGKREPGTGTST